LFSFVFKEEYFTLPWGEISALCTLCGGVLSDAPDSEPYLRLYKEDPSSDGRRSRSLTQQFHEGCFKKLTVSSGPTPEGPS
jgi:hypothetical protein